MDAIQPIHSTSRCLLSADCNRYSKEYLGKNLLNPDAWTGGFTFYAGDV
jgi:hypothetical protein